MKLLLDTHILLCAAVDSPDLQTAARMTKETRCLLKD
jgi:PIN domain nuclease of toxin-antitoxin system